MTAPASGNELLLRSFARSLRARNRSPCTVQTHLESAQLLAEYSGGRDLDSLTRGDIEDFLGDQLSRHRATTAAGRYRNLQQLYRWAVEEELVEVSPMTGLQPPTVPETPVPVLDDAAINRLLGTTAGRGFEDHRDTAIVRLFLDTGMRLSEVAGLQLTDVDLDTDVALVLGKGHRPRACPFGDKTGQAIERYLRERNKHSLATRPALWLGARGVLTGNGITQMLRRRAKQAGIDHLHPHMFRHTFRTGGCLRGARSKTSCDLPAGAAGRCCPGTARVLQTNGHVKHTDASA